MTQRQTKQIADLITATRANGIIIKRYDACDLMIMMISYMCMSCHVCVRRDSCMFIYQDQIERYPIHIQTIIDSLSSGTIMNSSRSRDVMS